MMNVFNVMGKNELLKQIVEKFPAITIDEKFDKDDWNVFVDDKDVDGFTDWCEDNGLDCKLV